MLHKVRAIIAEELGVPIGAISDETRLDELPMDSLEFTEIVLRIKNEIGDIPEDEIGNCETVGQLGRAIQ
jgi:acyl carrier protein